MKLNIGCGWERKDGYIGVDIRRTKGVDVLADMHSLPFREATFDHIHADQVLEHSRNPYFALLEIHRVIKTNGILHMTVPNPLSESANDPTHFFVVGAERWIEILKGFFLNIRWRAYGVRLKLLPPFWKRLIEKFMGKGLMDFSEGFAFQCTAKRRTIAFRSIPWWLEGEIENFTGEPLVAA